MKRTALLFVLLLCAPPLTMAHAPIRQFGDFYAGIFHPITAIEHLIPLVMLAFFVGQQTSETTRKAVIIVPLAFIVGGLLGYIMGESIAIIWINRSSFLILGLLVAISRRYKPATVIAVSSFFAVTHGYENLAGIDNSVLILLFLIGMLLCIIFLNIVGAALVKSITKTWQKIAIRVLGSWSTAVGLLIMGLMLSGNY